MQGMTLNDMVEATGDTRPLPTSCMSFSRPPARSPPERKNLRLLCRKDWLWLAKRALLSWSRRSSRGERLKGKEAFPPRCREANGGVAVVAAGAAMNHNGGHHAEVAHP